MSSNPGLSYEDTPPFSAPLRFFLTAPLFGIAGGVLLLAAPELLASRWLPATLALVHLLAAGFMLQVMVGALQQIMPVVAGAPLPRPRLLAGIVHPLMTLAAAALAAGLGWMQPLLITLGGSLLAITVGGFLAAAAWAILRSPASAATLTARDLRLALLALLLTLVLGLLLALSLARGLALPLPFLDLVDLHASWGLLGWSSLLLAATCWVVVPMFQITPAYPAAYARRHAPALFIALLLWSLLRALTPEQQLLWQLAGLPLLAALAGFALLTLRQQSRTRRSKPDASFRAFRVAMISLAAGALVLALSPFGATVNATVLAAVLIIHGGFIGAISAMLYKIVPFLSWLHLSQAGIRRPPNVKKLLPDPRIRAQLHSHHLSLALLVVAATIAASDSAPTLWSARAAGLAVVVEFAWLLLNIRHTLHNWQQARRDAGLD